MPVSSTPFGAGKKWLATKFESLCNGNKLSPLDWKVLDELSEFYSPEQLYMAMKDFSKICEREKRHIDFRGFGFYCRTSGIMPSQRLAEAYCLKVHFPKDETVKKIFVDIKTADEAWFRSSALEETILGYFPLIEEYKKRL